MKVFLSLRGSQLYNMLSHNTLLFTVYRDDIDTNIEKHDIPTLDMPMSDRMHYCLSYIDYLADIEFDLFRSIKDYGNYRNVLGSELVVAILMKGMRETIKTYYTNTTLAKCELVQQYQSVREKINSFLDFIEEEEQVQFTRIVSV